MAFRKAVAFAAAALTLLLTVSCASNGGKMEESSKTGSEADPEEQNLTPAKVILGWYAKGEDGGYFAALKQNFYKEKGIDMTIQPGGPEISALQLVASGKAEFGISYADELLRAREEGIPVVGLFSAFQYTPQVLIYHADQNITGFKDLEGRKIYLTPGVLYWEYIKKKFRLKNVTELNYTGQLVNFINDKQSLNQGYVTNEPYALKQQGVNVSYLKVKDSGYANYANVLFTTEKFLKEHPDVAEAVVKATKEGWEYYLDHYEDVNPFIRTFNQEIPLDAMNYEAEQERDFILVDDALSRGIGTMSAERWNELQRQLLDIGALKKAQDVTRAFTTQFLNEPE